MTRSAISMRPLNAALLAAGLWLVGGSPAALAAAAPVDTCKMLEASDVFAAMGKLKSPPQVKQANGSMLGGCEFTGVAGTTTLTAYPADELDGTVRRDLKKGRAKVISGLGEKAFQTGYGVMFQPAGKPYFLTVFVIRGTNYDPALSESVARKVKQ